MRVIIKAEGRKFWIPVTMCLGGLGIKYGLKYSTKTQVSKEQMDEVLEYYKVFRKAIKPYKGLKIVEVEDSEGKGVTLIV